MRIELQCFCCTKIIGYMDDPLGRPNLKKIETVNRTSFYGKENIICCPDCEKMRNEFYSKCAGNDTAYGGLASAT